MVVKKLSRSKCADNESERERADSKLIVVLKASKLVAS